ncbi:DUF3181 family protein [Geitlerinema sp. P-1104]|uniref:DUF3181 family protein n=1 Tax=Geitlerinema sp. P-1104 TaxID=2546230 RepID=UPI001476824B|nr:DUF3181 family protein [Geitlerinema sp. P-1104]NMG57854.1 DUF3181 family protein [Geitlerinema sp. P-1104]
MTASTREIEKLAAEIADKIYLDIAKWHLYLGDAHLHVPLAERFYPLLEEDRLTEAALEAVLQEISVPIGGGRRELPLQDLLPRAGQQDLMELLETYQKDNL